MEIRRIFLRPFLEDVLGIRTENTVLFSPLEIDKHTYIFGSKSMQGDPISLCHVYRESIFFFQFSFSIFLFNFRSLMEKRAKGNEKSASCHLKITAT